jgi:beta-galactosidase/evolved beta-galactosidase subunit alpha
LKTFITFNLDHKQHGLGSSSCGPDVLEKYRLKPEAFEFEIVLKPYSKNQSSPAELSKVQLEGIAEKLYI